MSMRRFTRLTNAFSKKFDNHCYALALYFVHYNFCRIHKALRVTPAMQAGICDHVMSMEDVARMIDEANPSKKRGPIKRPQKIQTETLPCDARGFFINSYFYRISRLNL
jgi:hypothetical protein